MHSISLLYCIALYCIAICIYCRFFQRALLCEACRGTLGSDLPRSCNKERSPTQLAEDLSDITRLPEEDARDKARQFADIQDDMTERQKEKVAEGLRDRVQQKDSFDTQDIEDYSVYFTKEELVIKFLFLIYNMRKKTLSI